MFGAIKWLCCLRSLTTIYHDFSAISSLINFLAERYAIVICLILRLLFRQANGMTKQVSTDRHAQDETPKMEEFATDSEDDQDDDGLDAHAVAVDIGVQDVTLNQMDGGNQADGHRADEDPGHGDKAEEEGDHGQKGNVRPEAEEIEPAGSKGDIDRADHELGFEGLPQDQTEAVDAVGHLFVDKTQPGMTKPAHTLCKLGQIKDDEKGEEQRQEKGRGR